MGVSSSGKEEKGSQEEQEKALNEEFRAKRRGAKHPSLFFFSRAQETVRD
jgi:hypothetical protein